MKYAVLYHRFSKDKQSVNSIERQALVTSYWMKNNDVIVKDTFNDDGYTAKNFDRPDVKKLFEFVKKNYRNIDYLVVAELTRFSRELGDAVNMVKKIQLTYGIKIVSAGRGIIYDVTDSHSFFMMSLEFLMGNSENIKRESDINGGIYAAKADKGRYIHGKPPYGYIKVGIGEGSYLTIDEEKAKVIRHIYSAYLKDVPFYLIYEQAKLMGFPVKGNSMIQKILSSPMYSGQQYVKQWREHAGGIFPAKHDAIIDMITWSQVQNKLKGKTKQRISLSDNFPLRGVLHCWCGKLVTGAPSRSHTGKYIDYYKCNGPKHNNISANKAHEKLETAFEYMSLTERLVQAIKIKCDRSFIERTKHNRRHLQQKINELDEVNNKLHAMEDKYISNKIEFETYTKWFSDLTQQRSIIKAHIEVLNRDENESYLLMENNLNKLTDLKYFYKKADVLEKQEFIKLMFDNKLSWKENIYRTPYVVPGFDHNALILKEKQLLVIEENRGLSSEVPQGGAGESLIEPITNLLRFFDKVQVA